MEYLKCNQLACRNVLRETAVITTCSHSFCIDCANKLFGNTRVCPACQTALTEPDDVVVSSLQPTNDYKTSVLSGLSPGIILQICERAISFWEYQSRQESAFQQAVLKSVNDKSAQCQKQLDSVLREANSELGLLTDKVNGLERELELERRKNREYHEQFREKDKEYAKLKGQYEQLKRKTLLAPGTISTVVGGANQKLDQSGMQQDERGPSRSAAAGLAGFETRGGAGLAGFAFGALNDVVNDMESGGVQRTPLRTLANGAQSWQAQPPQNNNSVNRAPGNLPNRNRFQSYPGGQAQTERTSTNATRQFRRDSEGNTSDSANEVENILAPQGRQSNRTSLNQSMSTMNRLQSSSTLNRQGQRGFSFGQATPRGAPGTSSEQRKSGTFRPAGFSR